MTNRRRAIACGDCWKKSATAKSIAEAGNGEEALA